jgi:hypothetical protein
MQANPFSPPQSHVADAIAPRSAARKPISVWLTQAAGVVLVCLGSSAIALLATAWFFSFGFSAHVKAWFGSTRGADGAAADRAPG